MRAVVVLQCTLVILAVQVAVACQSGEVVNARWRDGTWRKATILEVRDRPDGVCGQFRLAWHHTYICEDPTITGDDTRVGMNFCLVSRDSIQSCKQELCRWGQTVENEKFQSSGTSGDDESKLHEILVVTAVFLAVACYCACLRFGVQQWNTEDEVDEEKGMDADTPCATGRSLRSGRSFWNFTPKSATSSPAKSVAFTEKPLKWKVKAQRAVAPLNEDKKIVMQPEPVAAVLPAKNQHDKHQIAEQKHVQSKKATGRPPSIPQTRGSVLRHAALAYDAPRVPPPQGVPSPPPQLPTLLQHREGPIKSPPRKKPPLQGVPPQRPTSEQGQKGPTNYKPSSRAPFSV